MDRSDFVDLLDRIVAVLAGEAATTGFDSATAFESRVRELVAVDPAVITEIIDFDPHPQAFPDIAVGAFGIEVKFTLNDTWRSVANSVLERHRLDDVDEVFVVFGKQGGEPDVRWGEYEKCVMHVRTSHVPRFELELYPDVSLFERMGISYADFRLLPMHGKMEHIRAYARGRLRTGERLWWLEDAPEVSHTLPIQVRLYTSLDVADKRRLRAEAALLCPQVVGDRAARHKYDDAVLYILTYHGVLCHQARDLFSAGSVANPTNDDLGGVYIERAIRLLEDEMIAAADRLDVNLFVEYWGHPVLPADRIHAWLAKADAFATDWTPSNSLFLEYRGIVAG